MLPQAIRYFQDQWFELYLHAQTLIALCDVQVADWVHYLSTALRILDPALLRAALVALQPARSPAAVPAVTSGTVEGRSSVPVSTEDPHATPVELAHRRLAAYVRSLSDVARKSQCKRHTR